MADGTSLTTSRHATLYPEVVMKRNEATFDRVLRVVIGIGLLSLVFVGPTTVLGYIGLIPLITGLVGYCPLYAVFGFATCPVQRLR
jgi:hypothetical protein